VRGYLWIFIHFPPLFPTETAVVVGEPQPSVSASASVVEYESLTSVQQEEFRDVATESVFLPDGIKSGAETLRGLDYIYLDGNYYPTDFEQVRSFSGQIGYFFGLLVFFVLVASGLVFGITEFLVACVRGAVTIISDYISDTQFRKFLSVIHSNEGYIVAFVVFFFLIGGLPFVAGWHASEAVQVTDVSSTSAVVEASSMSETHRDHLYDMISGKTLSYTELEPGVYKSDGEYYQVQETYMFSSFFGAVILMGCSFVMWSLYVVAVVLLRDLGEAAGVEGSY
jgi:hypothetical protein